MGQDDDEAGPAVGAPTCRASMVNHTRRQTHGPVVKDRVWTAWLPASS